MIKTEYLGHQLMVVELEDDEVWCEWCGEGPWLGDNDYEHFCSQECIDAWHEHWRN